MERHLIDTMYNVSDHSDCTTCTITGATKSKYYVDCKTPTTENYSNVGDVLNYTIKITNNGNVTLNQILVTDPLTGLNGTLDKIRTWNVKRICSNYTVTQNEYNQFELTNIAYVKASTPYKTKKYQHLMMQLKAIVLLAVYSSS
jgi:hypothetical protein